MPSSQDGCSEQPAPYRGDGGRAGGGGGRTSHGGLEVAEEAVEGGLEARRQGGQDLGDDVQLCAGAGARALVRRRRRERGASEWIGARLRVLVCVG
jgi:hypothetical protein